MNRPWHIWLIFGLCLAVVLGAMGWVTAKAVQLDRRQAEDQRQRALEENVRLALLRMELNLMGLVVREGGRPYFWYRAFYTPERAYTRMFNTITPGDVLVPSPLMTETSADVLLYFQIDPQGRVTSPQVPTGNMREMAEDKWLSAQQIDAAATHLMDLDQLIDRPLLISQLPQKELPPVEQVADNDASQKISRAGSDVQFELNKAEWQMRQRGVQMQNAEAMPQNNTLLTASNIVASDPRPVWVGEALLFARRVAVNGETYVQGCRLNWPAIRERLLSEVKDLLPAADLEPVRSQAAGDGARTLASLPVRLRPGMLESESPGGLSQIEMSLIAVWSCVLLAAFAAGSLLHGTIALSERRAAFVSAVTHELRTPLTTFRMYTEMLLEKMVTDDEKRQRYLATLQAEAERLSHLVENVLSYARLERNRRGGRVETVSLGDLLGKTRDRLAQRAGQARMELQVHCDDQTLRETVQADVSAVEQILFNLVDNACKYAAMASDRTISIEAAVDDRWALIRVRDHGPGISVGDARRLFRPFCKSAHDAAHSAPGVGLGLTLSRRLARQMGGDLKAEPARGDGACLLLTLPRA